MAEKVIVTGAAGFIGSNICRELLSRGFEVTGVDSLNTNYDPRIKRENVSSLEGAGSFTFVENSLNELDLDALLSGADYVFHESAQAGVRQSWEERFEEYIDANIRATQRLCEAARGKPLKRFVFASSSSVYGETVDLPMGENHITRPHSPYGVTKLASEALCLLYRRNHGVPVVALRYFTVFGPGQRPDMAFHIFIKRALNGLPVEVYGSGAQTRDFTYVSDIVAANMAAMAYDGDEPVFNIGGGSRVTLNHTLDILGEILPEGPEVQFGDPVSGDVTHTYADISLAKRELGYAPQVGLEEGLEREVDWVRGLQGKFGDDEEKNE